MKRRILTWLLALCMLVALVPAVASNVSAAEVIASGGSGFPDWKVTSDGTLTLSGKRHMEGSSVGDFPWTKYADKITKIVVEDGLTNICDGAFAGMSKVTKVTLGKTLETIGEEAFRGCNGLTTITIPASVEDIGMGAFFLCKNLTTVKFASGSVLKTIGGSAFEKTGLQSIKLPSKVESIGDYAFTKCADLSSVTLNKNLKSIGKYAFTECDSLESLTLPKNVELAWYAFKDCGIKKLTLNCNVDYSAQFPYTEIEEVIFADGVTTVDGFRNCESLKKVTLADSVTTVRDGAFSHCAALATVNWSEGLEVIEDDAFSGTALKEVALPDSVTEFGCAFRNCKNMTSFSCGDAVEVIDNCAFQGCSALTDVELGDAREMGFEAFASCTSLTTVTLPDELESMGYSAFQNCTALESITIPASMKTMSHSIFSGCKNLKEITFLGNAPRMDAYIFQYVTATAHYPARNDTWTRDVCQNYGGTITWTNCAPGGHSFDEGVVVAPTCTEAGYTRYTCTNCGTEETDNHVDALGHQLQDQICTVCGYGAVQAPVVTITNVASSGKLKLSWKAVDGAAEYWVYRADSADGTYSRKYTTTGTSYTNTGAEAGKIYYYYVVAVSDSGNIASSEVVSRICKLARPSGTGKNVESSGKPKLTWKAIDGAVSYMIYRGDTFEGDYEYITTTTGTSYTDPSVNYGEKNFYKIVAVAKDPDANSAPSEADGITCRLARPTVSIGNDAASGLPRLTWEAVEGAESYTVYRSTSKDGEYRVLEREITDTIFYDLEAKVGKKYYYKVQAVTDDAFAHSAQSSYKYRVCDLPQPQIDVTMTSKGKPRISWTLIEGAVKYEVYRSDRIDGTYKKISTAKATTKSITNSSAEVGVTYYYKVRAVASNTNATSAYSAVATAGNANMEAPKVSITLTSKGKPRITWKAVEGAVKYEVYRADSVDGTYSRKYTTTGTAYSNTGATEGKTYYYRVMAISADGTAAPSEVVFINCSRVGISGSKTAKSLVTRLNEYRAEYGIAAVAWYADGAQAAKIRAAELNVYADTVRPNGDSPQQMLADYGLILELDLVAEEGSSGTDVADYLMSDEILAEYCMLDVWSYVTAAYNGVYWVVMFG